MVCATILTWGSTYINAYISCFNKLNMHFAFGKIKQHISWHDDEWSWLLLMPSKMYDYINLVHSIFAPTRCVNFQISNILPIFI